MTTIMEEGKGDEMLEKKKYVICTEFRLEYFLLLAHIYLPYFENNVFSEQREKLGRAGASVESDSGKVERGTKEKARVRGTVR